MNHFCLSKKAYLLGYFLFSSFVLFLERRNGVLFDEQKLCWKIQSPMDFHAIKYLHTTSIEYCHCAQIISTRHFPFTHPKREGFSSAALDSIFFIGVSPGKCFGSIDIVYCATFTAKCEILSRQKESLTIHGRNGSKSLINWRQSEKKHTQKMAICSQSARELSRVTQLFFDQLIITVQWLGSGKSMRANLPNSGCRASIFRVLFRAFCRENVV